MHLMEKLLQPFSEHWAESIRRALGRCGDDQNQRPVSAVALQLFQSLTNGEVKHEAQETSWRSSGNLTGGRCVFSWIFQQK